MAFIPASPHSMYRNHDQDHSHFTSPSSCAPQEFHGVPQFLMRRSMSFSAMDPPEETHADEDSDDGSTMLGEKKRRLNLEQVKALEKSFELGNKLEPERKMQLARALGLQPRQIAIWFQNRRARWKTKQLERDYDVLKRQFELVKADNDSLKSQNKKLQSQLMSLKSKESTGQFNLNKDNEGSWSNGSENSCDVNLNTTHSSNKNSVVYSSSTTTAAPVTSLTQLLQSSARPDHNFQLFHKIDHAPPVSNDALCNVMFGGIEENPEFWSWSEQQNYQ